MIQIQSSFKMIKVVVIMMLIMMMKKMMIRSSNILQVTGILHSKRPNHVVHQMTVKLKILYVIGMFSHLNLTPRRLTALMNEYLFLLNAILIWYILIVKSIPHSISHRTDMRVTKKRLVQMIILTGI